MLTHSIHLLFVKTEAGWREGCLCLNSDAATFILLLHIWAQETGAASNSKTQINEGFYGKTKRHAESNVHLHFPNKENTDLKHSPKEALNDQGEKRPEQLACIVQRTNENKHYSKTFFLCDLWGVTTSKKHIQANTLLAEIIGEHQKMPHRRFLSPFLLLNSINLSSVLLCECEPLPVLSHGQWIFTPSALGAVPVWDKVSTGSFIRFGLRAICQTQFPLSWFCNCTFFHLRRFLLRSLEDHWYVLGFFCCYLFLFKNLNKYTISTVVQVRKI